MTVQQGLGYTALAGQAEHEEALAVDHNPVPHKPQFFEPGPETVPGVQAVQVLIVLKVPAGHSEQALAPAGETHPAVQSEHAPTLMPPALGP